MGSPAHAGIDLWPDLSCVPSAGFPRTRGDRPDTEGGDTQDVTVPPHTRG